MDVMEGVDGPRIKGEPQLEAKQECVLDGSDQVDCTDVKGRARLSDPIMSGVKPR